MKESYILKVLNIETNEVTNSPIRKLEKYEFCLAQDEDFLIMVEPVGYKNPTVYLIITTKQVIAWCFTETENDVYMISRYTSEHEDHNALCEKLPDELKTMVHFYIEGTTKQTVEQAELYNRVMKGTKKNARVRTSRR